MKKGGIAPALSPDRFSQDDRSSVVVATLAAAILPVVPAILPHLAAVSTPVTAIGVTVVAAFHPELAAVLTPVLAEIPAIVAPLGPELAAGDFALAEVALIPAAVLLERTPVAASLLLEIATVAAPVLPVILPVVAPVFDPWALIGKRRNCGYGKRQKARGNQEDTHDTLLVHLADDG